MSRLLSTRVLLYVVSAHLEMDIMWHQEQGHLEDVAQVHIMLTESQVFAHSAALAFK